ncbi:MAG: MTAP family purine nucleoside phosphorylase [Candidatus Brocadiales bacterium]|nr:MTAP family purine nucleoside phosphorylase [Candidatus Bathyanammoxibius sp.]
MAAQFAVIGGSKAYELLANGAISGTRLGERETPFGRSQAIYLLKVDSAEVVFLSRHGEKGYEVSAPYVNYRANIYALKDMGVDKIVAWSGPGAINRDFAVGDFVVVDDVVDETRGRAGTFFEGKGIGFIRQNPVFCPCLRDSLVNVLETLGLAFKDRGTYVCTQGPRLETPAEIRKFASYGGELVGMTLVPEVFLARELEMCYAALCYVSNYAEGVMERPFRAGELFEGLSSDDEKKRMSRAVAEFPKIITELARQSCRVKVPCLCPYSMQRYKIDGRIGEDWRDWIEM